MKDNKLYNWLSSDKAVNNADLEYYRICILKAFLKNRLHIDLKSYIRCVDSIDHYFNSLTSCSAFKEFDFANGLAFSDTLRSYLRFLVGAYFNSKEPKNKALPTENNAICNFVPLSDEVLTEITE